MPVHGFADAKRSMQLLGAGSLLTLVGSIIGVVLIVLSGQLNVFPFVAVAITATTFIGSLYFAAVREYDRQLDLLGAILTNIELLTKKSGRLKGHVPFFRDHLGHAPPGHEMMTLNVDFYVNSLDGVIAGKATRKLKELLFHANDKIKMLNTYAADPAVWKSQKDYVEDVLDELEAFLSRIHIFICEAWGGALDCPLPTYANARTPKKPVF